MRVRRTLLSLNSVKSLRKKGGDRIDCGNALYKEKEKLYLMNEAAGKDYFIDWGYVNITDTGCPPPLRRRVPFSTISGG